MVELKASLQAHGGGRVVGAERSGPYAWEAAGRCRCAPSCRSRERESRTASDYVVQLIEQIADHRETIDARLQHCLLNWRLERLSVIDRNVLRIGAAELLFLPGVPPRVAIQEAILLAEKYGTEQSPRFVNGVLDALMREAVAPGEGT
jgi:N utilization substance protein B